MVYFNENLHHIEKVQRILRQSFVREKFRRVALDFLRSPKSKAERHRYEIEREILATEKTYVSSLWILIRNYLQAIRSSGLVKEEDIKSIFSNIEVLFQCNSILLNAIEDNTKLRAPLETGNVFLKLCPYLKLYTQYVNNYGNAVTTLERISKSKKISSLLLECFNQTESNLPIQSLMVQPIQRIPRYVMLLAELEKYTPAEHVDYESIRKALNELKKVAETVNERQRKYEQIHKVVEIQQSILGSFMNLVEPHRSFLMECDAGFILETVNQQPRHFHFFLFNDLILYVQAAHKSSFLPYVYEGYLKIVVVTLNTDAMDDTALQLKFPGGDIKIIFSSTDVCKQWKSAITKLMEKLARSSTIPSLAQTISKQVEVMSKSGVLHRKGVLGWKTYLFELRGNTLTYSLVQKSTATKTIKGILTLRPEKEPRELAQQDRVSSQTNLSSATMKKVRNIINLPECILQKDAEVGKRPFCFKLYLSAGTKVGEWTLAATNKYEYNEWINCLSPRVASVQSLPFSQNDLSSSILSSSGGLPLDHPARNGPAGASADSSPSLSSTYHFFMSPSSGNLSEAVQQQ
eukprot:TRINITY_DN3704_c0_g1_i1.p1 TRINITY_DN3704_c0_g1~~TRINITY_DN3704_c0_g1_i1.p1  ORF type:complete len:576 (+),score=140.02 TRINITY_DN3704_c0_g1_i1:1429-3156(+)